MPADDSGQACAQQVLDVVPPVVRVIRCMMRSHRLAGLSVPQFRTLSLLSFSPDASLSMLADYLGSSLPAASRMIDGLVTKKLVARRECCNDRRQVSLALTARGQSSFQKARQAAQRQLADRLEGLSADERKDVIHGLELLSRVFGSDANCQWTSRAQADRQESNGPSGINNPKGTSNNE